MPRSLAAERGPGASARPTTPSRISALARREWMLGGSGLTGLAFVLCGPELLRGFGNPFLFALVFAWLFAAVLGAAFSVVRHAEALAVRLGEPYGTLILTLAVTAIEVMSISAVTINGHSDATLARDTLFSALMILLNGMVGLSLLAGAWRRREQTYNLQGANTYMGLIIPLAVLSLILPNFTRTTAGPTLSIPQSLFVIVMVSGLYAAFLALQTGRHRGYFRLCEDDGKHEAAAHGDPPAPLARHLVLLGLYMAVVVLLAEQLARPIDYLIETLHAPGPLGGLVIAALVATPEAVGAIRAARADHLQRAVNIFLGSVLSTIGLTIPAVLALSLATGQSIVLGLQGTDSVMLVLTLAVSMVTFASGRTNVLQGAAHLVLFAAYLLLIFER
jgi:Ca2+:H+ antiporter